MVGSTKKSRKHLVLVGGGHAHLLVLESLIHQHPRELDVTLISPFTHQIYSGMVPGMIAGQYSLNEIQFELEALTRRAGGRFIQGRAVEMVHPRGLKCDGCVDDIEFDLISFNLGSLPHGWDEVNANPQVTSVKPIQNLVHLAGAHLKADGLIPRIPHRLVIVGAGFGGIELALALHKKLSLDRIPFEITLLDSVKQLVPSYPRRVRRTLESILMERGIVLKLRHEVIAVRAGRIHFKSEPSISFDWVVWATGAAAPPIFGRSGLRTDSNGFLLVNDFLQSVSHPHVFGGGDCVSLREAPALAKSGVYAVRQGSILAHNLLATARDEPLVPYRPQRRFLSILNTADGKALSNYFGLHTRLEMRWKDRIDRRFMARFQQLEARSI